MFTPKPYGSNSKTLKICYPPIDRRAARVSFNCTTAIDNNI